MSDLVEEACFRCGTASKVCPGSGPAYCRECVDDKQYEDYADYATLTSSLLIQTSLDRLFLTGERSSDSGRFAPRVLERFARFKPMIRRICDEFDEVAAAGGTFLAASARAVIETVHGPGKGDASLHADGGSMLASWMLGRCVVTFNAPRDDDGVQDHATFAIIVREGGKPVIGLNAVDGKADRIVSAITAVAGEFDPSKLQPAALRMAFLGRAEEE